MGKLIRFYNNNRKVIFKWVAVLVISYIILKSINYYYEQQRKKYIDKLINESYENEDINTINTTSKQKTDSKKDIVDEFLEYCKKTEDYDKAYELLSKETKEQNEYFSKENFVYTFINNFYSSSEDCIKTELNRVTKIYMLEKYKGNILETGNAKDVKRLYLTLITEDKKEKIKISDYIEEIPINKQKEKQSLNINIISSKYYYDYVEYKINITNKREEKFSTRNLNKTYIKTKNKPISMEDLQKEDLINPNSELLLTIRFKILYNQKSNINNITFVIDGNNEKVEFKI